MSETANLGLVFLEAAQAQKHVTMNEALRALDVLVQTAVQDRDLTAPPAGPAEGDVYFVAAGASADWAGHDGELAAFQDGAWAFHVPPTGLRCWIADEGIVAIWDGVQLVDLGATLLQLQNLSLLGVNASADAANRLTVSSQGALFTHAGNDMRVTVNKNAAGDTASLVFQTAWSGRAEFGLAGDDNFAIKVSPDNVSWSTAISIDSATAAVSFLTAPDTGSDATVFGYHAGDQNSASGQTAFGVNAGRSNSGVNQMAVGYYAGYLNSGDNQAVFGRNCGYQNSGANQTAFGLNAGLGNTASNQTAIGVNAGKNNTGSSMTALGYNANSSNSYTNATALGYSAQNDAANQVMLGNGSVSEVKSAGAFVSGSFVRPGSFTVATVPSASLAGAGAMIFVSNETGGPVPAFSDGTDWRRCTDRAIIS